MAAQVQHDLYGKGGEAIKPLSQLLRPPEQITRRQIMNKKTKKDAGPAKKLPLHRPWLCCHRYRHPAAPAQLRRARGRPQRHRV